MSAQSEIEAMVRRSYLDPAEALARLERHPERNRVRFARAMLATARNPRGRFGLDSAPEATVEALSGWLDRHAPRAAIDALVRRFKRIDVCEHRSMGWIRGALESEATRLGLRFSELYTLYLTRLGQRPARPRPTIHTRAQRAARARSRRAIHPRK